MLPWLILTSIGIVVSCLSSAYYTFVVYIVTDKNIVSILKSLFVSLLGISKFKRTYKTMFVNTNWMNICFLIIIAILGLMLWAIYNLYKDIREDNVNKPGRVMHPAQVEYRYQKPCEMLL